MEKIIKQINDNDLIVIGPPKAATNLANKIYQSEILGKRIHSTNCLKKFLQIKFAAYTYEAFVVIYLNKKYQVICVDDLFTGETNKVVIYHRTVLEMAIKHNAAYVIFSHNHVSQSSTPTPDDEVTTRKLIGLLGEYEIKVLDHQIAGIDGVTSFAENQLL